MTVIIVTETEMVRVDRRDTHTHTNICVWAEMHRFIRLSVPHTVFAKQGIMALCTVQLHNDGLNYLNYGACMCYRLTREDVSTQLNGRWTNSL